MQLYQNRAWLLQDGAWKEGHFLLLWKYLDYRFPIFWSHWLLVARRRKLLSGSRRDHWRSFVWVCWRDQRGWRGRWVRHLSIISHKWSEIEGGDLCEVRGVVTIVDHHIRNSKFLRDLGECCLDAFNICYIYWNWEKTRTGGFGYVGVTACDGDVVAFLLEFGGYWPGRWMCQYLLSM